MSSSQVNEHFGVPQRTNKWIRSNIKVKKGSMNAQTHIRSKLVLFKCLIKYYRCLRANKVLERYGMVLKMSLGRGSLDME